MRKATVAVLAMVLMSLISVPSGAQTSDRSESCRKFVQAFYDWYIATDHKQEGKRLTAEEIVWRRRPQLLSPELRSAIRQDRLEMWRSHELTGFDADVFTLSQENADSYVAGTPERSGKTYRVPVFGVRAGIKSKEPEFWAEVRHGIDNWQFFNFSYAVDHRPHDLLTELRGLKAERDKDPSVKK